MASYFPEEGNLNGRNADMCSDVDGPSSSGWGTRSNFQIGQILRTFTIFSATSTAAILDLSVTATTILPFGHVTS